MNQNEGISSVLENANNNNAIQIPLDEEWNHFSVQDSPHLISSRQFSEGLIWRANS
jgi:hypothetical protein